VNDTDITWAVDNIAFGSGRIFDHFACYEVEWTGTTRKRRLPSKLRCSTKFEEGTKVKVGRLRLLCVPTRKDHDVKHRLPR
jgi:hypothetical protein